MKHNFLRITFVFLLIIGTLASVYSDNAGAIGNFSNNTIADVAESYENGSYQGECKTFANKVVSVASNGRMSISGGYQAKYIEAGAQEVNMSQAQRGDIIQVTPAGSSDSTAESLFNGSSKSQQLHTAIVLTNNSGGNFYVIDSNSYGHEYQVYRHNYNPYIEAAGSIIKIWRLGSTAASASAGWMGAAGLTYYGSSTLYPGQRLTSGKYLLSEDGRYVLLMQSDGNVVEYTGNGSSWNLGTQGNPGASLVLQNDGNIVLYKADGVTPVWNTGPRGASRLVIQGDGNFVGYTSGNQATWTSGWTSGQEMSYLGTDTRTQGERIYNGQYIRSSDRRYVAAMQQDGNLVVYAPGYKVLWNSGTSGKGYFAQVQGDGNFVIYNSSSQAVWNSAASNGKNLVMQSDGNLVLYPTTGSVQWATWTMGRLN